MKIEVINVADNSKLWPDPIDVELGDPFAPRHGLFLNLATAKTSALLAYMNLDLVGPMIEGQLEPVLSRVPRKERVNFLTMAAMAVVKRVAEELDRRLPQRWG